MAALDDFVRQLIAEAYTRPIAPDVMAELKQDLLDRATDRINRRMIDAMDDATAERFNKLLDMDPPPAEVTRFVEYNVPNKGYVAAQALQEFRESFLGGKAR